MDKYIVKNHIKQENNSYVKRFRKMKRFMTFLACCVLITIILSVPIIILEYMRVIPFVYSTLWGIVPLSFLALFGLSILVMPYLFRMKCPYCGSRNIKYVIGSEKSGKVNEKCICRKCNRSLPSTNP